VKRIVVPRASYCVLAFGDDPQAAVKDTRCDFASSPHAPWTDWENPVHFPFGT
jgi:hypothetical protein